MSSALNLKAGFPGAIAGGGSQVTAETAAQQWADLAVKAVQDAEAAERSIQDDVATVQSALAKIEVRESNYLLKFA
jgi:hypothetical protein